MESTGDKEGWYWVSAANLGILGDQICRSREKQETSSQLPCFPKRSGLSVPREYLLNRNRGGGGGGGLNKAIKRGKRLERFVKSTQDGHRVGKKPSAGILLQSLSRDWRIGFGGAEREVKVRNQSTHFPGLCVSRECQLIFKCLDSIFCDYISFT